jgi:Baseplate J-like protein
MQRVQDRVQQHGQQDEVETIHLYVVREPIKRPYTALPLVCAFMLLVGMAALTLYSGEHPYYEHERLTVPAIFLPLKVFSAQAPVVPTGIKTYPATSAEGTLTIENGSVLTVTLPAGILFTTNSGIEVQTEQAVYIPAGSAAGYGVATVMARAVQAGIGGNIPALAVNAVYGTALYVRNLTAFNGGHDAYSVKVTLPKDRLTAIDRARLSVAAQEAHITAVLAEPCKESISGQSVLVKLTASCQYATYRVSAYMHVLHAKLAGKNFLVEVAFLPLPKRLWIR